MGTYDVNEIIQQLKSNKIQFIDIPKELENNIELVEFERKSGSRKTSKRGFDIITNSFFVEEYLIYIAINGESRKKRLYISFGNFDEYFDFLRGDIYDNACYTFCPFSEKIKNQKIDIEKLKVQKTFVKDTVDDYSLLPSSEEKESFRQGKQRHKLCQQWDKKFDNCSNGKELAELIKKYRKSALSSVVDESFFIFRYVLSKNRQERLPYVIEYSLSDNTINSQIIKAMCLIYTPNDVIKCFDKVDMSGKTIRKQIDSIKEFISDLESGNVKFELCAFFDDKTHYYCEETRGYKNGNTSVVTIRRSFETFEEFIDYRNGNLQFCDLSDALECNADFSEYITDKTTKLPINANGTSSYEINKFYRNGKFYVTQQWRNAYGISIKKYDHSFDYFFDFVAFLNGDLSDADLICCDGLSNLANWDIVDFSNAKMRSTLREKFGFKYETQKINHDVIKSFEYAEQNENETALILQTSRSLTSEVEEKGLSNLDLSFDYKCQRVHYISDIHLMHRIKNAGCRSQEDIVYTIYKIAKTIADEAETLLLIDGDVSSDFDIFQLFVKILSENLSKRTTVVFTLGNHELWSFPSLQIEEIVSKYRTVLENHGMYLLHNDLLYKEDCSLFANPSTAIHLIKYHDLCQMDKLQITDCLRSARYVILGGLGFSGYNTEFNADNGIYRTTVDRNSEIKETEIFERLYDRLLPVLAYKNTIIMTHTPKKDWCNKADPDKNIIYISGHTHKNFFHDDGESRIYSDNQVGYHNERMHLKTLLIDNDYDCFSDYNDGIYEITSDQYKNFYRGKNISIRFQREVNVLYMLKKKGYYCFIHKSRSGGLTILNGGTMKKLGLQDIRYYYDNMDAMISTIKTPLDEFTSYQRNIADIIKKIGGSGIIHGSIIDIDFYNHVYVNPFDRSVTGYWASDIINKKVYPSISNLLETNCPTIFSEYVKLLTSSDRNPLTVTRETNLELLPQTYFETDIYKASREIKKMQKLNSNILTIWHEGNIGNRKQIGPT